MLFVVAPILCWGLVLGPWYFVSFQILQSSRWRRERAVYFTLVVF